MKAGITVGGGQAVAVPTNVARPENIARLARQARSLLGRIDALVNVVGIGHVHSIIELGTSTDWRGGICRLLQFYDLRAVDACGLVGDPGAQV